MLLRRLRRAAPQAAPANPPAIRWPALPAVPPPYPEYRQVSITMPVWGKLHLTKICLERLFQEAPDAEIVVVDNASPDETLPWLRSQPVRTLALPENRGCPGGWKAGLEQLTGDVLIVMNNDVIVHPGGIRRLADAAWRTGIASLAGGRLTTELEFDGFVADARDSDYADGAILAFRRDVFEAVGTIDEAFSPIYCDDSDWSLRARLAGYGWEFVPDCAVHLGTQTARELPGINRFRDRAVDRLRLKWSGRGVGERILVRRWGAIGDVLMLTPALAALRRQKPLARIHLQTHPVTCELLRGLPCVDLVDPAETGDYTRRIDVDLLHERIEATGDWRHPAFAYADALEVPLRPERYHVPEVDPELAAWAAGVLPETGTLVACGIRSAFRPKANWSEGAWIELVRACPELTFVLFDPEARPSLGVWPWMPPAARLYDEPNVLDLTGRTPDMRHVRALLARCRACVSVDTGLLHLANAAGLPLVALFGGAPGWARAPLAGKLRVLQGDLPCYPCANPVRCVREDGLHCLDWVTGERVARYLREVLAERRG